MKHQQMIDALKARQAALGDGRDCRSERELADFIASRTEFARAVTGLQNVEHDSAQPLGLLAELESLRAAYLEKVQSLELALFTAPNWRDFATGRERDAEWDRQQALHQQLARLRAGDLIVSGVMLPRLADVDVRIAEQRARLAGAEEAERSHLAQAERLLKLPEKQVASLK